MSWGDPHYQTFDRIGQKYDFMGACSYVMVETVDLPPEHTKWLRIVTTNERRHGFKQVSYLGKVRVELQGGETSVELLQQKRIIVGLVDKNNNIFTIFKTDINI